MHRVGVLDIRIEKEGEGIDWRKVTETCAPSNPSIPFVGACLDERLCNITDLGKGCGVT